MKIALITGASSKIGYTYAKYLSEKDDPLINYLRTKNRAKEPHESLV